MNTPTISQGNMPFLEKVMQQGKLTDIYEAKDLSETVYRIMRDLMPKDSIERVESELHKEAISTNDKNLQNEISELWRDRNPLVSWLSKIRPPFQGKAPWGIDDKLFITRIENEGGLPRTTNGETIVKAVFSATKDELSQERVEEISSFLPGKIQEMWNQA